MAPSTSYIDVQAPSNLTDADSLHFPKRSYELRPLGVKRLRKVFVIHNGLCFKNMRLQRECVHEYPRTRPAFYRSTLREFIAARITRRGRCIELSNEQEYLTIHHPWINYYHWLLESVPRLLLVREELPKLTLLLPESYKGISYVQETLNAFQLGEICYIPSGHSAVVSRLVLPEIRPWGRNFHPKELALLKDLYCADFSLQPDVLEHEHLKIYITRKTAGKRKIENEEEVIKTVLSYGFKVVDFTELSFKEQIKLCLKTKWFIATHGASLTNLLFLPRHARVLELHKEPSCKQDFINDLYWHLASALGIDYFYQICSAVRPEDFFVYADISVDTSKLASILETMLTEENK